MATRYERGTETIFIFYEQEFAKLVRAHVLSPEIGMPSLDGNAVQEIVAENDAEVTQILTMMRTWGIKREYIQ